LIQDVKTQRRLRIQWSSITVATVPRTGIVISRVQDDRCGEIHKMVDLRGINLTFLRRHVNAHASTMQFAWSVVRLVLVLYSTMVRAAAADRIR